MFILHILRILRLIIVNQHTINNTNMLKIILNRSVLLAAGFKVEKFSPKDYKTMCSLIRQKYPIYNEAIQLNKDVKLVDDRGKLIGQYSASEARKKAITMKKDILLVNPTVSPAICKLENFRLSILKKFYEEIVNKRNQQLLKKASSSKQLKVSPNLSENELKIKSKQIIQLAKKNFNVRVYSICKAELKDDALGTLESLKSLVQNKCFVEEDIKAQEYVNTDEESFEDRKNNTQDMRATISVTFRSKQNEFVEMLTESSEKDPENALEVFLKRYYKQEDVEMRDLKAKSQYIEDNFDEATLSSSLIQPQTKQVKQKKQDGTSGKVAEKRFTKQQQKQQQEMLLSYSYVERQAKARILNERLKRILDIAPKI